MNDSEDGLTEGEEVGKERGGKKEEEEGREKWREGGNDLGELYEKEGEGIFCEERRIGTYRLYCYVDEEIIEEIVSKERERKRIKRRLKKKKEISFYLSKPNYEEDEIVKGELDSSI